MPEPTAKTRPHSLRAPITNEEERVLFQRRLALAALVVFGLAFTFYTVQLAAVALVHREHVSQFLFSRMALIQLGTTALALVIWLMTRGRACSPSSLGILDAVAWIGVCLGWTLMSGALAFVERRSQPESIALLACTYTLVVRAAILPSTPARTAVIGAAALAPIIAMTTYVYTLPEPPIARGELDPVIPTAIWCLLGVAATTVISRVIYGLRVQMRKAMQLGQYVLEDKIGEGGMGVVYRARHAMLRRPTAIKLLSGESGQALERFEREVQITARLTHPNTVAVFDYGRTPDGVFYYAMEYLDGISLEDLVEANGAQPIARVVHVLLQICGALEEAHAAGLVHRDIKPANVMLTERGGIPDVVKVLDFGLVKESVDAKSPAVTNAQAILGTPHYMAPEAIVDPEAVDGRTDLYALGAVAYYLLTGKRVFDGSSLVEVCSMHLHQVPPAPSKKRSDVPAALDAAVLATLAKKKEDRPADAAAFATLLRAVGVAEWTREDARAWWAEHEMKQSEKRARANDRTMSASAFGKTVAVALDERVA
jgi:serine/threonine-protein kinase